MKSTLFFIAWMVSCVADAQTSQIPRTPVPSPRPLMIAALSSTEGAAFGVLTGANADAISKQFKAVQPVYIDVTTLKHYAQAGCSRLKVLIWQDGVILPNNAAPRKQTIEFGINYCRDGLPPGSLIPR